MSIVVCFTLYSGKGPLTARLGRRICFWIPVNMPERTIPGPNPLFQIDGKAPSWLPDAVALASVEALIPTAGKEMAAQLRGVVAAMLPVIQAQLPPEATISAAAPRARRAIKA